MNAAARDESSLLLSSLYIDRVVAPALWFVGAVDSFLHEIARGTFDLGGCVKRAVDSLTPGELEDVMQRTLSGISFLVPMFPIGRVVSDMCGGGEIRMSVRQLVAHFRLVRGPAESRHFPASSSRNDARKMTRMALLILSAFLGEVDTGTSMAGTLADSLDSDLVDEFLVWVRVSTHAGRPVRPWSSTHTDILTNLEHVIATSGESVPVYIPCLDGRLNMWMVPTEHGYGGAHFAKRRRGGRDVVRARARGRRV
jgi:hypothetical protein